MINNKPHYDTFNQYPNDENVDDSDYAVSTSASLDNFSDDEDRGTPFLPIAAYVSVVANSTNALLGVNIFAVPWGFSKSGMVGGTLISIGVAALSFGTALNMLEAQRLLYIRTGEVKGYPEIAAATLGSVFSTVVQVATAVSCLGGCVSFLIFLGELCGQLFDIEPTTAVIISIVPLVLLSWIRSFQELTVFTVAAVLAILAAIVMVVIDGQQTMKQTGLGLASTPAFTSLPLSLNYLGPATFTFTIHYCVLSMGAEGLSNDKGLIIVSQQLNRQRIENELTEEGRTDSEADLINAAQRHLTSNNGNNKNSNSPLIVSTQTHNQKNNNTSSNNRSTDHSSGMIPSNFATAATTPLSPGDMLEGGGTTPSSSSVSPLLPSVPADDGSSVISSSSDGVMGRLQSPLQRLVTATSVASLQGLVASTWSTAGTRRQPLPPQDISRALGVSYVLTCMLVIFHGATGFFYYRTADLVKDLDGHIQAGCEDRVCQNIILNLADGPVKSLIGVSLCFAIIISYVMILAPARENLEEFFFRRTGWQSATVVATSRNVLRALLVVSTAVVAIMTPYFGSVLGTVGGLTDALQAFVLPPLIYVQMASSNSNAHALTAINTPINSSSQTGSSAGGIVPGSSSSSSSGPKLTPKRRLVCAAITAWGLATMIYTTWKIVQQGWNFESTS